MGTHDPMPMPEQVAQAFSHPLRVRILVAWANGSEHTTSDIAVKLEEPLETVAYHVRRLHSLGVLERSGTEVKRGAVQHSYMLTKPYYDLASRVASMSTR